ncbi:MAG: hypothetical protein WCJ35_12715 [Planctomycetota bacterium]
MTSLLQSVVQRALALPEEQQNALAALLLEEIESEQCWQESFARSPDVLDKLAEEALEEDREGRTMDLADLL